MTDLIGACHRCGQNMEHCMCPEPDEPSERPQSRIMPSFSEHILDRYDQQVVRIAELEKENEVLKSQLKDLPERVRRDLLHSMRRAGVNCGRHYGCWLAGQYLDDDK